MKLLEQLCCQNSKCMKYGQRGAKNLSACGWTDQRKTIRQLYCSVCKARFSERKGTPLYDAKLPLEKVIAVLQHVREGCGVRQTGRLVGVTKDTANRYIRRAGEHARHLHQELVAFSPSDGGGPVRRKVGFRL